MHVYISLGIQGIQMLFDNSAWNNCKSGILITTDLIVVAESKHKRVSVKWGQIENIVLLKSKGGNIKVRITHKEKEKEEKTLSIVELTGMRNNMVNDLFKIFTAFNNGGVDLV